MLCGDSDTSMMKCFCTFRRPTFAVRFPKAGLGLTRNLPPFEEHAVRTISVINYKGSKVAELMCYHIPQAIYESVSHPVKIVKWSIYLRYQQRALTT